MAVEPSDPARVRAATPCYLPLPLNRPVGGRKSKPETHQPFGKRSGQAEHASPDDPPRHRRLRSSSCFARAR